MNHRRTPLLPFVLAPAFLAFVSRGENPSFGPEEGTSVTKRIEQSTNITLDDMLMSMNGQEMDAASMGMEMESTSTLTVVVTDTYTSVGSGRPTKLVRTFDELGSNTSISTQTPMGPQDMDLDGASELQGLSVVFEWDDEAGDYAVSFADGVEGDDELLVDLAEELDLRQLLPTSEVSEGDTWEVEPDALRQLFAPGGALKIEPEDMDEMMGMGGPPPSADQMIGEIEGEVTATFNGTRDEDGVNVAVIALKVDVSSANDLTEMMSEMMAEAELPGGMEAEMEVNSYDVEFAFEGEGELLWNMSAGLAHSMALTGEVSNTMDMDMNMNMAGNEMAMENSTTLSGNQEVRLTFE